MSELHIIWNPVAGNGAASAAFAETCRRLDEKGVSYSSVMSEYPGHGRGLAEDAVNAGHQRIVAIGGDGTVREVASALMGKDAALGIIPSGTGNDLVRPLHIPADVPKALDIVLNGEVREMDAARANDELYFNVAGFGFDVDVLDKTELYKRQYKNGSVAYIRGLLSSISNLALRKTKITWPEGELEKNVLIIAAGVGTHFGGGMAITPKADPFDGLLDVCIIHDVSKLAVPFLLPKFLSGKHLETKYVTYFRTTELSAVCEPASRIEVDGEVMPGTPVVFRILPKALHVLVARA